MTRKMLSPATPGMPLDAGATMTTSFSSANCLAPSTSLVVSGPTTTWRRWSARPSARSSSAVGRAFGVGAGRLEAHVGAGGLELAVHLSTASSTPLRKSVPNEPSEPV